MDDALLGGNQESFILSINPPPPPLPPPPHSFSSLVTKLSVEEFPKGKFNHETCGESILKRSYKRGRESYSYFITGQRYSYF